MVFSFYPLRSKFFWVTENFLWGGETEEMGQVGHIKLRWTYRWFKATLVGEITNKSLQGKQGPGLTAKKRQDIPNIAFIKAVII